MDKTCTRSSQTRSQHAREAGDHKFPPLFERLLAIDSYSWRGNGRKGGREEMWAWIWKEMGEKWEINMNKIIVLNSQRLKIKYFKTLSRFFKGNSTVPMSQIK